MSEDHEDLMERAPDCYDGWREAIDECAIDALNWNHLLGETELVLRIDSDQCARVWRTKLLPDGELWVWSRDPAPGSAFELEWVFDDEWLVPYWWEVTGGRRVGNSDFQTTQEVEAA